MMQKKTADNHEAQSADRQHDNFLKVLDDMGDFNFLDEIPDDSAQTAEMPFPYGSPNARPYGWYSS